MKRFIPLTMSLVILTAFFITGFIIQQAPEHPPQQPAVTNASTVVAPGESCSTPVQLPPGSEVERLADKLRVILPLGYRYGGLDEAGLPFFEHVGQDSEADLMPGDADAPTMRREVEFDCDCSGGGGWCSEVYNVPSNSINCAPVGGCTDCSMTIISNG